LLGETGTGKELVAHAIHAASARFGKPFVSVNVAAIPENLMEADFFGVAPGAYTGASRQPRLGKFQLANKGSLFLDEIGDMPLPLQAKFLRILQDQTVEPLGSNTLYKIDVRIIAATSRNLAAMVRDGSFRSDLYYRLNVLPIQIPPLRQRREDIALLACGLIERIGLVENGKLFELTAGALEVLREYDWPGNVRELENVLQQACLSADSSSLVAQDFVHILRDKQHSDMREQVEEPVSLVDQVGLIERGVVMEALRQSKGNKSAAAKILGITRPSLYAKMSKYLIGPEYGR
jgi:transcriptional regulator with PAS, ATPase and Fis domain